MSISPQKELDPNNDNSNACNSEEPKNLQEQRSLVDPSTELGSKSYFLIFNSWYKWINKDRNIP